MFSFNNKLDINLKTSIANKEYKTYRVIISCKTLHENIESKIKSYKGIVLRSIPSINCLCATVSPSAIEKLLEFPQINFITFDTYCFLCNNTIDIPPLTHNIDTLSGGLSVQTANRALVQERYKLSGKEVGIGIIDSGVYPHADLTGQNTKIKGFLDLIFELKYPYDDNGHGAFISGLLCGNGQCSKNLYKGIAENSHLYVIKAFNEVGKGYVSDILFALEHLITISEKYNLKILTLPFEIVEHNAFILSLFSRIFNIAIEKRMTILVPSGHNGNSEGSISGIATLNSCITIGGLDTAHFPIKPYRYSSAGQFQKLEKPNLCAAAVNLISLNTNKNYVSERNGRKVYTEPLLHPYTTYSGTSCAVAFIAGICALLYENKPSLNHKDILALLKVSCNLLDISKWIQGAGMIDLNKLLP